MIKYQEQHKHYGFEALDHMVEIGRQLNHKVLKTSCHMADVSPYNFYLKYGFKDTKEVIGGEQVLIYDINGEKE